ncbi:alanine--tRNA ligase [Patescibacteria group bacterium]|nr:alanine--tRNA ligase [Patescibacteria group bacterium]
MKSEEIRKKFLDFFKEKGHKIVPSSSLLPTDPSVLFTTAGMQQFKEYFLGKKSPFGKRVTSCQKCFRTSDIEEVGNDRHLTFLEMLGNFSFGDYFKKETIEWALEFLTGLCKIPNSKLWFGYFKGDSNVPEDKESYKILQKLGIPKNRIYGFGREDNFWGPTGEEGPCGPTCEVHYDLTQESCSKGKDCIPNCECGGFIEIWNLVFNEYYQDRNKKLTPLKQKGVDTGMGLERLAMVLQGKSSVFETDLFTSVIKEIEKQSSQSYTDNPKAYRIMADHIKGAVFLASEGVIPSNLEQGYTLRRILRRAIRFGKLLNLPKNSLIPIAQKATAIYQDIYPKVKTQEADILTILQNEEEKFEKTLERGLKEFRYQIEKCQEKIIPGRVVFDLYQSYGFPLELTEELAKEEGLKVDKQGFEGALKKHQEISRAGVEKKFGGVGKEATHQAAKLHTATHLLHQALREVLGEHVKQMGSDITPQRLRFDFSHPAKLTEDELKKVEDLVNQKIKEDLKIQKEEMSYEKAIRAGALAFFKEKYPEKVKVYSIGDFSKEICGGPHVSHTGELGHFKIIKEESSGAGVRRIRAIPK